jgi:ATP-dependent Clp protease protease subunit
MAQILAHHSGRALDQVKRDIERDYYLTAEEALQYGLIDEILAPRRGLSAPMVKPVLEELQVATAG